MKHINFDGTICKREGLPTIKYNIDCLHSDFIYLCKKGHE